MTEQNKGNRSIEDYCKNRPIPGCYMKTPIIEQLMRGRQKRKELFKVMIAMDLQLKDFNL